MDDLAALSDVTGPAVLTTLQERFKQGQYHTYCGDLLLSLNPGHDVRENESELGQWYRRSRPLQELPPHTVAMAHRAYRMLVNDVMPQAIVLMGRPRSGKTEAARRLVSQLLREARLSPRSGLGPRIIMAQHVLTSLMTARTLDNPDSTRGIKMATLYFRSDGGMVSAELQALCMDKWFLTDRRPGCGVFTVFYAMMAGMSEAERRLYFLSDTRSTQTDRLLSRNDSRGVFLDREDLQRHVDAFDFLLHCLHGLDIDQVSLNYAGKELSAILAVLAAILHLGNIDITVNPQSGRLGITNPHDLALVCDLLALGQDYLEEEILSVTTQVRGEVVRMACSEGQALWNRDLLLVEMYRRLVSVLVTRLNQALSPDTHYIDHGPLTPISVVDVNSRDWSQQGSTGGLEAFFRNMAAERLQGHLYDVIFQRDQEACQRERVPAYKIKFADNKDIVSAVFGPDHGIVSKVRTVSLDAQGSPDRLVALMDGDRSLKKNGSYVHAGKAVKSADVFFVKHSGLGQVTYTARDFIAKNRCALPESARQMLMHSDNPLLPIMASVSFHESGFPPDVTSPDAFLATRSFQSDLTYLLQTLDHANLHLIRCLKAGASLTPGQFDGQLVTDQLKESCVVETARQRKFGFSTALTQEQFIRSYRDLAFSAFSRLTSAPEACRHILVKTGLQSRGVTLSKTSVFLRYWHVERLQALRAEHRRQVVTVQAVVRGFLARRRFRRRLASFGARPGRVQPVLPQPHPGYSGGQGRPYREVSPQGVQHSGPRSPGYANGSEGHQPGYRADHRGSLDDSTSAGVGGGPSGLYRVIIDKVLDSLQTLDPATWAKVIYLERGRQVAKVYVEERSLIVDGSHAQFDGSRLGLGLYRNQERDEETAFFRSRIIEGVRLKHEEDDSISACRMGEQGVVVKAVTPDPSGLTFLSEDVLLHRGHLPFEKTIKIFDMKEFRSKIALDLKHRRFSKTNMRRACAIGLAFGREDADDTQMPCWLCIVNVKALASLESEEIVRQAQVYSAELQMASPKTEEEKLKAEEARIRHERERWSRVDQREHLREKEEGVRQVRQKLRAQGLAVGDHVGYSWDTPRGPQKTTMQDLQEWAEPEYNRNSRKSRGSGQSRDWAKVETAIRDEKSRSGVGGSTASVSDAGY